MKMKRCLTLCGKTKYVKGKNGRPIVAARIGDNGNADRDEPEGIQCWNYFLVMVKSFWITLA